jgi:uncharacterized membrane protein
MWFWGLLVGLILGGIVWGFDGAVALGFLGWFAGLILGGRKKSAEAAAPQADRLSALEMRFDALERRIAKLERGGTAAQAAMGAAPAESGPTRAETAAAIRAEAAETLQAARVEGGIAALPIAPGGMQAVPESAVAEDDQEETIEPKRAGAAPAETGALAAATPSPVAPSRTPPRRAEPPTPAEPNFIVRWFTEGNAIVRVGVVILFIGLAFLVKYAADHAMFPIELRLASVAFGGIALLFFGWRLREKREGYALTLQGAGIAVLFLTVFGAFRLYHLLPGGLAFFLLVAIALLSAVLAVRQDSMSLAIAGSAGGFLAPILASTGGGSHVMLFSYYAVLNLGILAVAWRKAWRPLNLVGFAFTFVIGLMWGARFYQPHLFDTTEPFLILFFLMYVMIAIMFAHRQAPRVAHYVDGTLIFGVPLVAFGLQHALTKDTEYGLAISSLVLAFFYLGLAKWLYARGRETLRMLVESFLALGVIFATLAIPLALDARWTSAAWALEGAGIVWIGVRQGRLLARCFGMLLQLVAGAAFLHGLTHDVGPYPIINSVCIGAMLMVGGGLLTYRQLSRTDHPVTSAESQMAWFWFAWALVWWVFGGLREIDRFILPSYKITVALLYFTGTAVICSPLWKYRGWTAAQAPVLLLLPVFMLLALMGLVDNHHPFAAYGWLAWPVCLFAHYRNLLRHDPEEPGALMGVIHAGTLLLIAALGAWEVHWLTGEYELRKSAWSVAAVIAVPGFLLALMSGRAMISRWPVERYREYCLEGAGIPIAIALWMWTFYANFTHAGGSAPLPYLPLLNALDLGHIFVGLTIGLWWLRATEDKPSLIDINVARIAAGAAVFVWLNAILLRTLHHWADIPYRFWTLWRSVLVQTSISIFWTLLALALMFTATRKGWRGVWMLGASLMGVVIVKLLFIDLSNVAGIERIVSFIGVGVLMLVIGYFSPMPPKKED